jgi:nucleolar GTP-binding protein
MGGAGVFNFPLQEHFILQNADWKYDEVPEFMDGKNIADYVDKDIMQKLLQLEKEEEQLDNQVTYNHKFNIYNQREQIKWTKKMMMSCLKICSQHTRKSKINKL